MHSPLAFWNTARRAGLAPVLAPVLALVLVLSLLAAPAQAVPISTAAGYDAAIHTTTSGGNTLDMEFGAGTITFDPSTSRNPLLNLSTTTLNFNVSGAVTLQGDGSTPSHESNTLFDASANIPLVWNITGNAGDSLTIGNFGIANMGGAVFLSGPTTIDNSINLTFSNNQTTGAFGLGGAIYAEETLSFSGSGNYTFSENSAYSGGAILAVGTLNFSDSGNYTFSENSASGYGGAIFANSTLNFSGGGSYTFSNNQTTGNYSYGGAIYAVDTLNFSGSGSYTFSNNQTTGHGGAIYAWDPLAFNGTGTYTFTGNQATGGGGAIYAVDAMSFNGGGSYSFEQNQASDKGGAISVLGALNFSGSGSYNFSENTSASGGGAIFANNNAPLIFNGSGSYTFQDNQTSDSGGAILVWNALTFSNTGSYVFQGNQANNYGGAISLTHTSDNSSDIHLTVQNASFLNNSAGGYGGAIGVNAYNAYGTRSQNVLLSSTSGKDLLFAGNTHKAGGTERPNSIAFYIPEDHWMVSDLGNNLTVSTDAGSSIYMLDPMHAAYDNAWTKVDRYNLNVTKSGVGTWVLGGYNEINADSIWKINTGSLHLVDDVQGNAAVIKLVNPHSNGYATSFELKTGTNLLLTPGAQSHEIQADGIYLDTNSTVGLASFAHSAWTSKQLTDGPLTVLTLSHDDIASFENYSTLLAEEGEITIHTYKYEYSDLAWNNDRTELSVNLTFKSTDRDATGDVATGGPVAIASAERAHSGPGWHSVNQRAWQLGQMPLNALDWRESAAPAAFETAGGGAGLNLGRTSLWATPGYSHSKQSGYADYRVKLPSFSVGLDHWFTENVFAGAALQLSWPDYSSTDAGLDGENIGAMLYGGVRLPYGISLNLFAGYESGNYDQSRRFQNDTYTADVDVDIWSLGFGLARKFDFGTSSLTPFMSYELVYVDTDGYTESGTGLNAQIVADHSETLHFLRAGLEGALGFDNGMRLGGKLYYAGLYGDNEATTSAVYLSNPAGGSFASVADKLDRHSLGLGLDLMIPVYDNLEIGLGYNFLAGEDVVTHQGGLNVTLKF